MKRIGNRKALALMAAVILCALTWAACSEMPVGEQARVRDIKKSIAVKPDASGVSQFKDR